MLLPRRNPYRDVGYVGRHWGRAGSGILYSFRDKVLLLERSSRVKDPHTWGIPGGAIPEDTETGQLDDPYRSALREVAEELGGLPPGGATKPTYKFRYRAPGSRFRYTTYAVELPKRAYTDWEPQLNWEHVDWGWFGVSEALTTLDLHPGVEYVLTRS